MNLFNLFAKLTLDTSDYEKKIDTSKKSASSFSSKIGTAMKTGAAAFMAVTAAVTATAGVVTKIVTDITDLTGEIDDNAQRLGMSTDAFQKWQFALKLGGAEISTFQTAIRELTNFTTQLAEGQGEALIALEKLGIGYEDFMAMTPDEQFKAIIESLQGMESQTEKTRLAQELFGNRAYQDLMPILNMEVGAIDDLFQSVEDLGLIMSEDAVQAGAALGDKMDIIRQKFTLVKANIVSDFFPAIELLLDGFVGLATGSDEATEQISEGLSQLVDGVYTLLGQLIEKVPELLPLLINYSTDIIFALFDTLLNLDWGKLILGLVDAVFEILFVSLPALFDDLGFLVFDLINKLFSADGLANIGKFGINLGISLVNGIIQGLNRLATITIPGLTIFGQKVWDDTVIKLFEIPTIPVIKFAKGGMLDDLMNGLGTVYAVGGEAGAEIAHTGSRGTGIANVEQIADAQYMAMQDYGLREEIARAAEVIVNGVVSGLRTQGNQESRNGAMVVKIGEREFRAYVVEATNQVLRSSGRKSLNKVTAY